MGYSDYSVLESNDNEIFSAGTYTKTISYTPNYNSCNPVNIQVTVIVNKSTIYIDPNWYFYRNNSSIYNESDITYDITYPVKVEFVTGNDEVTASLQTYYNQTEANNYGSENITSLQNAGYYKTIATLSCDSNYQACVYGSTEAVTELIKEWSIQKAQYYGTISWGGVTINPRLDSTILFAPIEATTLSANLSEAANFETLHVVVLLLVI